MEYERPNVLRGVHFGPGTSLGFDIGWWVNELKQMGMGWVKIVDDAGSMFDFAKACRDAGIMPIVRMYRKWPNPGVMGTKDLDAIKRYVDEGVTRWVEVNNEGNLPVEWLNNNLPQPIEQAARIAASNWIVDAERTVALGAYPAIPALAQCGHHGECSSIRFSIAFFDWLKNNADDRMAYVLDNGGWLAVHGAVLNHAWVEDDGWHFEHPYNLGKTPFDDDNSLMGYIVPRDLISERWGRHVPVISTEGGVFHIFRQWDTTYPNWVRNSYDHAVWTLEMYKWLDEWQKTHQWWFGMCEWLIGQQILGHQGIWDEETWYRTGEVRPVVQMLKDNPPRQIDAVEPPEPEPPDPIPPIPPQPDGFPRPPGDNGLGIHAGLELTDESIAQDIVWMKAMRIKWATVAYTNEDAMMRAARALWAAGIMPICRWVGVITKTYDFARDARMLLAEGIPAYIQIFNEPSDPREWKDGTPADYIEKWAGLWVQKAGEVVAAGGLPGLQCLHPEELQAVFNILPWDSPIWDDVWFCSHNYGLNHPPAWKEDYWCVLGFQFFEHLFREFLGFVPPIICGEGGWLYKASNDDRYPIVDDALHAQYHDEMFRWFLTGRLSDGEPLPDHLYAVCPWILSGPSDEAWFGFTERVQTIQAVQAIPQFVRGEPMPPEPEPPVVETERKAYLKDGSEADPAELLAAYSVEIEPFEGSGFRVVEIRERCEAANCDVWVKDGAGFLMPNHPVRWGWPGSEVVQNTGPDGKVGFAMSRDAYYLPSEGGGPHWTAISIGKSEIVRGIGMVVSTVHCTLNYVFRYVDAIIEPEPPEPPEPPIDPDPDVPPAYSLKARLEQAPHGFDDMREAVNDVPGVDLQRVWDESLAAERIDENGVPLFGNLRSIVLHHLGDTYYDWESLVRYSISKGYATVYYHFLIEKSGMIRFLVPVKLLTHHAGHRANQHSISIAFEDEANETQLESGRFLLAALYEFMGQGWGEFRLLYLYPHSTLGYVDEGGNLWHSSCPGDVDPPILWSGPFPKLRAP